MKIWKLFPPCLLVSIVMLTASAFAAGDDAPAAPKPTGDLGKLQGKWSTKVGPRNGLDAVVTLEGKDVVMKIVTPDGFGFELVGEITLDENARPHKTVNWQKFKTPMGDNIPENLGIYRFENDDTIEICNGGPGNQRPNEYKAEDGGAQRWTFKRIVEKAKDKDKEKDSAKPKEAQVEQAKSAG